MLTEQAWNDIKQKTAQLRDEIAKAVVGQRETVEFLLASLLCRGHCLIVGVPGLGKTLLVRTLGRVLGLRFNRVQFTPDLMPTDILGSEILQGSESGMRRFEFCEGPVFTNLLLADEINRTPPKTQAALLEAMQERQVTVAGTTRLLQEPFVVVATQNPIEHEGTYPLPEAQLDRFLFSLRVEYPAMAEEREILAQTTGGSSASPQVVLSREAVLDLQTAVPEVPVPEHVVDYLLRLVGASRPGSELADDFVRRYVAWGAGPRASQTLLLAAKALALLGGQPAASVEEVERAAHASLRHRIIPNYNATGEGIDADKIVDHLLQTIKVR